MAKIKSNGKGEIVEERLAIDPPVHDDMLRMFQQASTISRAMLSARLGTQFNGNRDLYQTFGYVYNPQYQDYRNLYDRQGIATRAVEKFADDTWNKPPVIIDGDARSDHLDDKATPFLKEWVALTERLSIWQILRQADIMLGFSRYSVVFLGAPGEKFSEPAGNGGLFYLQAFDESQATILSYITNVKDEKFGMPLNYSVAFNAVDNGVEIPGGNQVHYSRIIHISENRLSSRIYGRPRLQTVINRLFDLEKVTGGGAEAAWLAVYKGMLFTAREGAELPAKGSPEAKYLNEQIDAYVNRIQRFATLSDVDVHDMGVDQVSVKEIYSTLIDDFAGSIGMPKRILLGSERGELASSQDTAEWNGVIRSRRTNFADPELLRPLINWCIIHKVISPPQSGKFKTEWEDVYPMTKGEKADYGVKLAQGATTVTGGTPDEAMDVNEWRAAVDLPARSAQDQQKIMEELAAQQDVIAKKNPNENQPFNPDGSPANNPNNKIQDVQTNTFEGHAGRPGKVGGSRPRDAAGIAVKTEQINKLGGMIDQLRAGGFSVSLAGVSPTSGYMTAISDKTEKKLPIENVSKNDIMKYANKNYAGLQAKDAYLGGWTSRDKKTGQVYAYLDVSINFQDRAETVRVGRQANQLGIYDVKNQYTIMLNDPGGRLYRWEDETETKKVWLD